MTIKKPNINDLGDKIKTLARVPINDEAELKKLSDEAQDCEITLRNQKDDLKLKKDEIKESMKRQAQIITDIIEMKHSVEVDAQWRIDWNRNRKDLVGFYNGTEIYIEEGIELTEMDRQLKLPDVGGL